MPTYSKGTLTEFCDINQNVIAVGDKLRAEDGSLWTINRYLQAVPDGPGHCINKLAAFVHQYKPVILDDEKPAKAEAPKVEAPKVETPKVEESPVVIEPAVPEGADDDNRAWLLQNMLDQELVDELRARGFTVTAKKTIVIEL